MAKATILDYIKGDQQFCRPPYMDPRWVLAANDWQFTTPTLTGGAVEIIRPANPKRWAIGFVSKNSLVGTNFVAPHNDPVNYGWAPQNSGTVLWFTQMDYGPLVQNEWYVLGTAGKTLGVFEVIIS